MGDDPYVITDEHGRRWSICPHCFFGCEHVQHHGAPPVAMAAPSAPYTESEEA